MRLMTAPCRFEDAEFPIGEMGPFLPVSPDEVDVFNDFLAEEIDSSFTSSICCCDLCYDDFAAHWPSITFREMEFQKQSMGVFWLVDYSRLPGIYSLAEISTLKRLVRCPRCHAVAPYNVWLYEHKFKDAHIIEVEIEELLTLGRTTPFLILEHSFAQRVLAQIRQLERSATLQAFQEPVYRARQVESVVKRGQSPAHLDTYSAPPAAVVGEGRFNHAGIPMLYVSSSAETAAAEIGVPGAVYYVGKLRFTGEIRILDLVDIGEDAPGYDLMQALASSALLAAPRIGEGWVKREYVFSRFVADCAISAGFDAIRYGSTKKFDGDNYVLLRPPGDLSSLLSLEENTTTRLPF